MSFPQIGDEIDISFLLGFITPIIRAAHQEDTHFKLKSPPLECVNISRQMSSETQTSISSIKVSPKHHLPEHHLEIYAFDRAVVLNSSSRIPALCIFCMPLLFNTPDSNNQLVKSMHELCSDSGRVSFEFYRFRIQCLSIPSFDSKIIILIQTFRCQTFILCHFTKHSVTAE